MDSLTRFWLIRHGEPAEEAQGRCYGSLDIGLSAHGRTQIERVARYLNEEPIAAVYTSPRLRALESARILGPAGAEIIPDFREIDFGDFEGLCYEEIAARYPEVYRQWMAAPTEVRFPNGESFAEMRVRVVQAFDSLRRSRQGQTVAVVTHGGVIRILIAWALEIPDRCLFRTGQDYAAMNLLSFIGPCPSVQLLNGRAPECGQAQRRG